MKFTVTPLGGGRASTAKVVDSIVRYLQSPPKAPTTSSDGASAALSPERYYADQGEEPGRWLGRTAGSLGLTGPVQRADFASMLAGRNPHTGERLITAQGSAGRRRTLGSGAHTRLAPGGEALFGVADAAAALEVTQTEVERMLDAGAAVTDREITRSAAQEHEEGHPTQPSVSTPPRHPIGGLTSKFRQPEGSYMLPIVEADGSRWVRASELDRCLAAREAGVDPNSIRALGGTEDQLTIPEAARLAGVTNRYLRGLARYYEDHRDEIERSLAAGRHPRRAFLVAHRTTRGRWLVQREDLALFLERRRPPAVRVAYDLTLTTEKSLGVLALLSDNASREAVLSSVQAGNDWALNWLQDRAVGRVDGEAVPAEGLVIASFQHLTSRALDPFPHHHNVIINTARMPDGTHRGLWSRPLYANAHAASALATAEMRHQLTKQLGVQWRPGRKSGWEIDGIEDRVIREFSKRRTEIDDALRELEAEIGRGAHPNEVEHIVLQTRPAKNHTPTDDLVTAWRDRAAQHGLNAETLTAVVGHDHHEQVVDTDTLFRSLVTPDGICAGGSVFSRSEALAAMANHPVPTGSDSPAQPLLCGAKQLIELTDQFLQSEHVIELTETDEPLYTTVEMLKVQDRIYERFESGLHQGAHIVHHDHVADVLREHPHLTNEQQRLVIQWCESGHRFQTGIGRAGAGKTTTVAACAQAWTNAGYRVLGAAVKGEATRTLAEATGIECETVAWYLAHVDNDTPNLPLDSQTILVIDEASTLSDRDLDALISIATRTGASIRLIGDPAQHGAIAAGGMFRVVCDRFDTHTPELMTTHRLRNAHDRIAAEALRQGRIDEALDALAAAGHLHVVGDDLTMYRQILGTWWDNHQAGIEHPMVDRRNTTRRELNRLAHLLRRVHGELGERPINASGNREFTVGDHVTARAPNRALHVLGDRHAYIRNGALGTITAVHTDKTRKESETITVDFSGIGEITVPRRFFDHHKTPTGEIEVGIDHAYALTSYAVQGSTHGASTSRIDPTATRAEAYVDITRGRQHNHLWITTATDRLAGETLPSTPDVPADMAVAARLHRSTGELTAWEVLNQDVEVRAGTTLML